MPNARAPTCARPLTRHAQIARQRCHVERLGARCVVEFVVVVSVGRHRLEEHQAALNRRQRLQSRRARTRQRNELAALRPPANQRRGARRRHHLPHSRLRRLQQERRENRRSTTQSQARRARQRTDVASSLVARTACAQGAARQTQPTPTDRETRSAPISSRRRLRFRFRPSSAVFVVRDVNDVRQRRVLRHSR